VTHDGNDDLANHVCDTAVKIDDRGTRIRKDKPLTVAAVVAYDLACDLKGQAFKVW
jgi:hypothetical protein